MSLTLDQLTELVHDMNEDQQARAVLGIKKLAGSKAGMLPLLRAAAMDDAVDESLRVLCSCAARLVIRERVARV